MTINELEHNPFTRKLDMIGTSADWVSRKLMNGSFQETFDALVIERAGAVIMTLEQSGSGDLTMQFSDGNTILDCTGLATVSGLCEATLTAGSDTSPTENFVYILQSDKILTVSTSDWPATEHIKISYFLVPSSAFVATNGVYINQNWNDHLSGTDNQGHLLHIGEKIRRLNASYFSGLDGNGTDNYLTPTAGNVELKITSGIVYQMHKHTQLAFDTSTGDIVLIKNWNGDAYHDITNLYDVTADSTGAAISNNKYFNLAVWCVANKSGEFTAVIINLPSGSYNTQSSAENDVDGYDDFSMPREFNRESSTGFLIARITIQMKTGGGTWVVASTTDLRGLTPAIAAGGAISAITNFADNQFTIFDEADITKIIVFDVGTNVTAGNTRTYITPDSDGTLALLELAQAWSATQTFDNIIITTGNNITVGTTQWTSGITDKLNADSAEDGVTNAIVTLTQETNWDTHLTSDGSDHTFIDQSVISGSSPTFTGTNFTGIPIAGTQLVAGTNITLSTNTLNVDDAFIVNNASDKMDGTLSLKEQAAADGDTIAYGQIWVKTATPNELWFTDDAGTDFQLGVGGAPGGADTQLQYNDGGSFGGLANLTWDDTDFLLGSGGTTKLQFRDSAIFIHSNADGEMTIEADSKVTIGVAGTIELGDGTERTMQPQTDLKINFGSATNRINDIHMGGEFHITRESVSAQPTPAVGELKVWRDPDDNKTYLIYNDTDEGVRKIEII